jgi:hypothetical protein
MMLQWVPILCQHGLARSLGDVLALPTWLFWEYVEGIRRHQVAQSVAMGQAISVAVGGNEEVQKEWDRVLNWSPELEKPVDFERTEESQLATLEQLAGLFAGM